MEIFGIETEQITLSNGQVVDTLVIELETSEQTFTLILSNNGDNTYIGVCEKDYETALLRFEEEANAYLEDMDNGLNYSYIPLKGDN